MCCSLSLLCYSLISLPFIFVRINLIPGMYWQGAQVRSVRADHKCTKEHAYRYMFMQILSSHLNSKH